LCIRPVSATYKDLIKKNQAIENEYTKAIEQYKKIIIFILANNFDNDLDSFNNMVNTTYNLPDVKNFVVLKRNEAVVHEQISNETTNAVRLINIVECYNSNCIKISVDKDNLLIAISKRIFGVYANMAAKSPKKVNLFIISIDACLTNHKNLFFLNLLYFILLYFIQSPFLIIKNIKLEKNADFLTNITNKLQNEVSTLMSEREKFYDSTSYLQGMVSNYFTYYAHQLVTKEVYMEDVDVIKILRSIQNFFNHQLSKKKLKVNLAYKLTSIYIIKTDKEMVFIVLLNFIFKAIYRSSISSTLLIRVTKNKEVINIRIKDNGYEYTQKANQEIKIFTLPMPLLNNLYQKLKLTFTEMEQGDFRTCCIKLKANPEKETNKNANANIIKLNLYDAKK